MEKNSIKGVIYLKFEDASRPIPLLHLPKDIEHNRIKKINDKLINYLTEQSPKQNKINILNFESKEFNGIIMFEEWKQRNKYWGKAKTAIVVLTNLEKEKIKQKINNLRPIFKKYIRKFVQLEKQEAEKERYLILLEEFSDKL